MSSAQWVIEYESGPGRLVGPFPTKEAAEEWAARYVVEYRKMSTTGPGLEWNVAPLASPASLEWW